MGAALLALTLAGPVLHARLGDLPFIGLALTQGGLVLLATRIATTVPDRRALPVILGVALALRLALLPVAPHLSTDAYRYVWDGRVQNAGINPYRYVPAAPEVAFLRDAAVYPFINRADYAVTIYPPAAQALFLLVTRVHDGLLAMKLAMVAFEAVTVLVLLDFLRRLRKPAGRVLAYAWHPLAVWEIAGSAHIDAAMTAGMMLGLWLALATSRRLLAATVLTAAALLKPLAALALPAALRPWDPRGLAVVATVAAVLYLPYLGVGGGVAGFLPAYFGEEKIDTGDGFWLVSLVHGVLGTQSWTRPLYLLAAAVLLGLLALRASRAAGEDLETRLRRIAWLGLAALLALSPNYPWYYLMLTPFVALLGAAPLWVATVGCFVLYDVVWYDAAINFALCDSALNVAVLGALFVTLRPRRAIGAAVPPAENPTP